MEERDRRDTTPMAEGRYLQRRLGRRLLEEEEGCHFVQLPARTSYSFVGSEVTGFGIQEPPLFLLRETPRTPVGRDTGRSPREPWATERKEGERSVSSLSSKLGKQVGADSQDCQQPRRSRHDSSAYRTGKPDNEGKASRQAPSV
ncbi:hypothetical protein V5799_018628 [Amblyomma americanum]|uniref:Uncharacterized protein n=1 Tax=Amblyomma americanum TaxID=6943 RepID=A0AAQ4EZS8_AMBAM